MTQNMSAIKGDSILSNLSNISVKICNKGEDGSEIFQFPRQNEYGEERMEGEARIRAEYEIKIEQLEHETFQRLEFNPERYGGVDSLWWQNREMRSSMFAENNHFYPIIPIVTTSKRWIDKQEEGLSEEENQEASAQINTFSNTTVMIKNQTKNIPKNYGKAIISFIDKYRSVAEKICSENNVPFNQLCDQLFSRKKSINTIADLRDLWTGYRFSKCMRIISNIFLRKYSLSYIFNSRICNFKSHIKYRHRLCQAIKNPNAFKHIKDY